MTRSRAGSVRHTVQLSIITLSCYELAGCWASFRLRRLTAYGSKDLPGTPATIVEAVRELGLEGVIAKRKASLYVPGDRSEDWQKLKLENQQEFVVGGYRPGGAGIDALLVGYYDDTDLRFAGKVRAGFVPHLRRELAKGDDGSARRPLPFHRSAELEV